MFEAPLGDDVLRDDPTVQHLEALIARIVDKETALFFPSGTQSNQVAVQLHAPPGTEAIVEQRAHIFNFEAGGAAALSGVQLRPVSTRTGVFDTEELESSVRPRDEHSPQTALLCLENTHNGHGGRIYPIERMEEVSRWARGKGLWVHLDGARLFNAVVATGVPVERYARCADTVSLCLSKGLGAPIGTCLAGDAATIDRARWIRKRFGGGMRQVGILAAAGIYALTHNIERMAEDHAMAKALARNLDRIEGLAVNHDGVETNIILIDISERGPSAQQLMRDLAARDVLVLPTGPKCLRLVTHLDVPDDADSVVPERFADAMRP